MTDSVPFDIHEYYNAVSTVAMYKEVAAQRVSKLGGRMEEDHSTADAIAFYQEIIDVGNALPREVSGITDSGIRSARQGGIDLVAVPGGRNGHG